MTGGETSPLNVLLLAGTSEARQVIGLVKDDPRVRLTASLAGATKAPASLGVTTRSGGFGGPEGMAAYCQDHNIALIVDVTHPFAREISRNAAQAAASAGIPCFHYDRPQWTPEEGDNWRSFDDWQSMADAITSGERVFLAGGTQSIEIFTKRNDILLWARALNVEDRPATDNVTFINAMPEVSVEAERQTFQTNRISLLCCKNSGGPASVAKIYAARELGIPVWLLARHSDAVQPGQVGQKHVPVVAIHDSVDDLASAIIQHAASTR